jgi:DeoR family transcriptional regulator of aga operon
MISQTHRHQSILSKLSKESFVNVLQLCKELNVSSVTIRKDLKLLEDRELLFRTHGGATAHNPYTVDRPVNEKEKLQSNEKMRIGARASRLIQPNDSIIIASGTTVLAFARSIQMKENFTAVTSSLPITMELIKRSNVEVLQLGGSIRKSSSSVIGPYSQKILEDFLCSKVFLGVDGIDLEFGLTTTDMSEAYLNRKMIEVSQKLVVLSDSTKFGKRGFGRICGLEEIDEVITDSNVSDHFVNKLEAMGIIVTVV